MLEAIKIANLGFRFILELCALAALGYWGFHAGDSWLVKILLGIGTPILAAVIWGTFVSPKAAVILAHPFPFLIELVVFGSAALALYATGQSKLAFVFLLSVFAHRILLFIIKQ